jgi:hypothetical protein
VQLPDWLTDRVPVLSELEEDWQPVPRYALYGWLAFYLFFLYEQAGGGEFPNYMNLVFVPVHEGGHLLFRWFGMFISVAGGTFLQLAVPLMLATYFALVRQPQGVAFCMFFHFQQYLPTATYMADARAQVLPLITVGDSDYVIHDWNYLFDKLGVLQHDTQIAAFVRTVGWLGMLATVGWFVWRSLKKQEDQQ